MYCDTIQIRWYPKTGEDSNVMKEMKSSHESDGSSKLLVPPGVCYCGSEK